MTDAPLLTIGAFARAVGLTPSALRHYDECGLLPPAEVDESTGYRYYTPELTARARLIVGMREAGVPIESMRRVLDGSLEDARGELRSRLADHAESAGRAESALRRALAQVERGPAARISSATLDAPALASALRQVRPAAEADPASPLASVLVDVDEGSCDVVATNRYWMAVRTVSATGLSGDAARAPLALPDAARLADALDGTASARLEISDGTLSVRCDDDSVLTTGRRDVAYPAHRLVLAGLEPPTTRAVLDAGRLTEAVCSVGRAELDLELAVAGAAVRPAPDAGAGGAIHEPAVVGGTVRGPAVTLRLGTALLRRSLDACLGPEVVLEVAGADRPVGLRSPYQPGFRALVMPIRTS